MVGKIYPGRTIEIASANVNLFVRIVGSYLYLDSRQVVPTSESQKLNGCSLLSLVIAVC